MLNTYLTEIIGAIALIVVIIIYFIIKKSQNKPLEQKLETIEIEEIEENEPTVEIETKTETEIKVEEPKEEEDTDLLSGKEEGSFGEEEIETQKEETTPKKQKQRAKRDIPPHGKIVKDNFKEFAGTKILVAEDNLINQKVISGLLADTGIELMIADDGQDALDILEQNSDFSIILMDAHMPRVDGFEATKIIRENPNYDHILVVALSGDTAADDIKKMRDAGMEEQLEKPLRMDALYDILYAYTNVPSDESDEDDDLVEVIITKELDGNKGLEVCGGDETFYNEILDEFVNSYADSVKKLNDLINNNDIVNADRFLLDVVGITANIGAANLHDIAQNLKDTLQNNQIQKALSILKEYELHLTQLLKDIKR